MFYFESAREWRLARSLCHKQNSEMATAKGIDVLEALANQRKHLKFEDFDLFLGLKSKLRWTWVDGEKLTQRFVEAYRTEWRWQVWISSEFC